MPSSTPPVEFARAGAVAVLRLQGRHGNALNEDLLAALGAAFARAGEDEQVRAVMLTSAGKLFSPGLDLQELEALDRPAMERFMALFADTMLAVYTHGRPVLAAISGHAVAGGCILALACDQRVLRQGAQIGLNEVKVGVPLPFAVAQLLRETVHRPALTEIALLGKNYRDEAAIAAGLVHEVLPTEDFEAACLERAAAYCSRGAAALARTKAYLRHAAVERIRAEDEARRGEFLDCWFSETTRNRVREVVAGLRRRS